MKKTKLNIVELNRRAEEVFELKENDYICGLQVTDDDTVKLTVQEVLEDGTPVVFDYLPDMTGRPEALAYMLGETNQFSD